jgi:hypothetical protein
MTTMRLKLIGQWEVFMKKADSCQPIRFERNNNVAKNATLTLPPGLFTPIGDADRRYIAQLLRQMKIILTPQAEK